MLRVAGSEVLERISGLGEVFSSRLLHAYLCLHTDDYALLDARDLLIVRQEELGVAVDWQATAPLLADWRQRNARKRVIVTGYVARNQAGRATVLGRNGSDYSGAIFAAPVPSRRNCTSGPMSMACSPPIRAWSPKQWRCRPLSYHEACELAYFGAKVIHPQTMTPAIARGLPILIRNTFRPEHPGTRIDAFGDAAGPVKGLNPGQRPWPCSTSKAPA